VVFGSSLTISSQDSPLRDPVVMGKADGEVGNANGIGLGIYRVISYVSFDASCRVGS